MKHLIPSTFAILSGLATAKVLLAVGPSEPLAIGDTYDVEWLVDTKMTLELWLVKQNSNGWEQVSTLFSDVESKPCNGSYEWFIDDSTPTGNGYGLWLNGDNLPKDGTGYADMSEWFEIQPKKDELR